MAHEPSQVPFTLNYPSPTTQSSFGDAPPSPSQPLLYLSHLLSKLPVLSYSEREKAGLARSAWFRDMGRGYHAEQATRPQTLGYGLADSPVGLLAWTYEKLVEWTDGYAWDDDGVLMWISIYYFSRTGSAASLRICYEFALAAGGLYVTYKEVPTTIPVGYSYFPKELFQVPRSCISSHMHDILDRLTHCPCPSL